MVSSAPASGRVAACAWLCALAGVILGASPASAATSPAPLGAYTGGGNAAGAADFGTWLGQPPAVVLDYLEWNEWSDISDPIWLLDQWEGEPYTLVLSVPMLPNDGSTLAQGAAGSYDHHFTQLAQHLVVRGLGSSVIRLGWEFNHNWFPWYAGADPTNFVSYWRRIADSMRAVAGSSFTFDWSANLGGALALESVYPGDAYVDFVGLDVYNHDWDPGWQDPITRWTNLRTKSYGLAWHKAFAATYGKQMSFPEWGMIIRDDGHGGGDDPYFIERMYSWIVQADVAYQIYFDADTPSTQSSMLEGWFPLGAARYRDLFGPASQGTPATPTTAPAKPSAPNGQRRPRVQAKVRRLKRNLRLSITIRNNVPVRRVDVLVDGRRVCRDRKKPFRCSVNRLALGRHKLRVRVHDVWRNKTAVARLLRTTQRVQKPLVLRSGL